MVKTQQEIELPKPKFTTGGRGLTEGEKIMAHKIFKDAIEYRKVKIHDKPYAFFQAENMAITPNGEIYFHPSKYQEDFSAAKKHDRVWFIHEMVHVWQYQLGYNVKINVLFNPSYEYTLAENKRFCDYNMEQQSDIIADYYALAFLKAPQLMRCKKYRTDCAYLTLGKAE